MDTIQEAAKISHREEREASRRLWIADDFNTAALRLARVISDNEAMSAIEYWTIRRDQSRSAYIELRGGLPLTHQNGDSGESKPNRQLSQEEKPTMSLHLAEEDLSRDAVIARIRAALKRRSGKNWSVTGGRGTAWGWITISCPPARRDAFSRMPDADQIELAALLGMPGSTHTQGVSIADSYDYYREYLDRAEGRTPRKIAQPYWD